MKDIIYYYIRDNGRPIITVCLLLTGRVLSREIAICSDKDNPCKKVGRSVARGRAKQAVFYGATRGRMRRININKALQLMEKNGLDTLYKAVFNPFPTDFECKLLGKKYGS